ncbi:MAG TPA: hypothetical protein VFG54_06090 [Prolixibacteraceae bacterium]|nr:hypothetical protein [Prolixibacteraceae bacterium]
MKRCFFHSIIVASLLTGCNLIVNQEDTVAKVGNRVLTMDDLKRNVPDYLDDTDSALWADDYIHKWVQRELLLMKAEEHLQADMKDVTRELEEYRNSLIVYRYKNELMKQKMDTTVNEADVQKYLDQNRNNFILNHNIVKAIYIKVPLEFSNPDDIKDLCTSKDPAKQAKLNEYCLSYAKAYDRFNDQWVIADLVLKNFPKEITDQQSFLSGTRFMETKDRNFYYFLTILDYKLAGQVSPSEYVYNDIRNLILNKQKIQFLQQIEKDIYKEGIDSKKVKLFKTKNNHL